MTPNDAPETIGQPRRVLASRSAGWARGLARWLGEHGVRPNPVSLFGVLFAALAGASFYRVPEAQGGSRILLLVTGAVSIQLRLLCNMIDGMLAVEGGFKSKVGDIYNDLPDRVADVIILVGAGYAIRHTPEGIVLGWLAAVLAVGTAYVRLLGGALGVTQHFIGPMAKQHRMFALTLVTLLSVAESLLGMPPRALRIGLWIIVIGSVITVIRRTGRIAAELENR